MTIALFLFALLNQGCLQWQFYHSQAVAVTVRDAESGVPIPGAKIQVLFRSDEITLDLHRPSDISVLTDNQGAAIVPDSTFRYQIWGTTAPGYFDTAPGYFDQDLYPGFFEGTNIPPEVEIRLFRTPAPQVTLVLPNGFHGLVRVELQPKSNPDADDIGRRDFSFQIPSDGRLLISAPAVLLNVATYYFDPKFRYENGSTISYDTYHIPSSAIRVRLKQLVAQSAFQSGGQSGGEKWLFVIGTQEEADAVHSKIYSPQENHPLWNVLDVKMGEKLFDVSEGNATGSSAR